MTNLTPPTPATPYVTFAGEGAPLSALSEEELVSVYKRHGAIQLRGFSGMGPYRKNTGAQAGLELYKCPHTDSVKVVMLDSVPQVFAPNAFSPDGDDINDVFRIAGFGEKEVKMSIFNRWGEQIWANEGMEPYWDGSYSGGIVKQDVYVYVLKYTGICNNEEQETVGHVTVIR